MNRGKYSLRKLQFAYKQRELERRHELYGGQSCDQCWNPIENNFCRHCYQEVNTKEDAFLNLTAEEFVAI